MNKWLEKNGSVLTKYRYTVFSSVALSVVLCNIIFIINGNVCPDGLLEGMQLYGGASWAISLGRWAIPIVNFSTLNVVMPVVNVCISILSISISVLIIIQMWRIDNKIYIVLSSIALAVSPAVVCQYLYIYLGIAYSLALLFAVVAAYFMLTGASAKSKLLSSLLLAVSLGLYQSYVGFAAGLIVFSCIIYLFDNSEIAIVIRKALQCMLWGLIGCLIYAILTFGLQRILSINMASYGGASSIGFSNSIKHFIPAIKVAYQSFINYYLMLPVGRWILVLTAILVLFILLFSSTTKIINKIAVLLLLIIQPAVLNIIAFIAVDHEISLIMSHQISLLFPFLAAVICQKNYTRLVGVICNLCGAGVITIACWAYFISGYCTHYSIHHAYKTVDTYVSAAMSRVMSDKEYDREKKVLFVGAFEEAELQRSNELYGFSLYKLNSVVWSNEDLCRVGWNSYMKVYHGIDIGELTMDEYRDIISSEEFVEMGLFPSPDSIRQINNTYVIKISNFRQADEE